MRYTLGSFVAIAGLTSSLFACMLLVGCSGHRESLEASLPQSYFLPSSPAKVWRATLLEASRPGRRILVNNEDVHVISWVSKVDPGGRLHGSLSDPDVTASKSKAVAITVIHVEGEAGGSRLTIRQTYCSRKPFVGVSSSRGNYEQEILRMIRSSLVLEATSHAESR